LRPPTSTSFGNLSSGSSPVSAATASAQARAATPVSSGSRSEAIAAYCHAIATDPSCADAHYNLSRLYEHLGQGAPALRHLRTYRALTGHV